MYFSNYIPPILWMIFLLAGSVYFEFGYWKIVKKMGFHVSDIAWDKEKRKQASRATKHIKHRAYIIYLFVFLQMIILLIINN